MDATALGAALGAAAIAVAGTIAAAVLAARNAARANSSNNEIRFREHILNYAKQLQDALQACEKDLAGTRAMLLQSQSEQRLMADELREVSRQLALARGEPRSPPALGFGPIDSSG